jgi:hypothetical protein
MKIKSVTIGTDLFPHLVGLRISMEKTPFVTKHEVVKFWSQITYVNRDLFAGRKPRHAEEGSPSPASYLQHVVRGETSNPIGEVSRVPRKPVTLGRLAPEITGYNSPQALLGRTDRQV